jgi:hypothetical protein
VVATQEGLIIDAVPSNAQTERATWTSLRTGGPFMCIAKAVAITAVAASGIVFAQGPTFDVVSIKRNTGGMVPGNSAPPVFRPDGSLALKNVPVNTLIVRAYPDTDIVGLPDWVRTEQFDIATTSSITTAEDHSKSFGTP